MSKDEFLILKEIFNLNSGTIENGIETYKAKAQTEKGAITVVLTFKPKNMPTKRYNIEIVK